MAEQQKQETQNPPEKVEKDKDEEVNQILIKIFYVKIKTIF